MSTRINEACEAIAQYGAKSVSDWQLFTAIGVPERSARELMSVANNAIGEIARMSVQEISKVKGIGRAKATAIVAALEVGRRRQVEAAPSKEMIMQSSCIYNLIHPHMRDLNHEEFWIILLDRRSKVIKVEHLHVGGMASMVVDPKIIFQRALQYKACSVILAHNHPSGAPSPSMEDIRLTEKVKLAGTFIDIKVLDHVIIGDGCYYSFADEGKI